MSANTISKYVCSICSTCTCNNTRLIQSQWQTRWPSSTCLTSKPPKITSNLHDIILTIEHLLHKTIYLVLFIQNNDV